MVTGAATLGACATQAPAPAAALLPGTPVIAATPPAATSTAKAVMPYGYTRVMVNGEERFCRNDVTTGSRTEHTKVCLSQTQLDASQQNSQDFINSVQGRAAVAGATGTPSAMGH
jgi:hypothetical protein